MAPNPNLKTVGPIDLFRPGTFKAMEGRTASAVWERVCPRSSVGGDEAPHRGQARSHNVV